MEQQQMQSKTPPSGMRVVSKEEFYRLVMAEKRDVMPNPERNETAWRFNGTHRLWGWHSEGYMPSRQSEIYAVAA